MSEANAVPDPCVPKGVGVPSLDEMMGARSVLAWMKLKCGLQATDTVQMFEDGLEIGLSQISPRLIAKHERNHMPGALGANYDREDNDGVEA